MLPQIFVRWASRLRLPWLTAIVGFLFVADLIIPDFIPLLDELVLGLATTLLVRWKKERGTSDVIVVNEVTPPAPGS